MTAALAVAANTHATSAAPQLSNNARPSEPNEFRLPTQTSVVVLGQTSGCVAAGALRNWASIANQHNADRLCAGS